MDFNTFKEQYKRKSTGVNCSLIFSLMFCLSIFSQSLFAISINKLKKIYRDYDAIMGITFFKGKSLYSTFSASTGKNEDIFKINSEPQELILFQDGDVKFSISSYPEFYSKIQPIVKQVRFLQDLPKEINVYLKILKIPTFQLSINYIFIYDKSVFFESEKKPTKGAINLDFLKSINDEQINNFHNYIERFTLETSPHELFHFLVGYAKFSNMNELREELYAHIFGKCVVYGINNTINTDQDILEFSDKYFINPENDLKVIRGKIKKIKFKGRKLIKSRYAGMLALYYFQAVANNHSGKNIQSDRIPKFCLKLFSEQNFKHPIEKKPPVWFKEFLQSK